MSIPFDYFYTKFSEMIGTGCVCIADVETLHGHRDYEQVILDVKRSMKRFPPGFCDLLWSAVMVNVLASGICRVEHVKALGVTISRKFSVLLHVDELLTKCSQSVFVLRTLRQHGLPPDALHAVFQAVVVKKLTYTNPAWYGFTSAANRGRLGSFLRRSARLGYRDAQSPLFDTEFM